MSDNNAGIRFVEREIGGRIVRFRKLTTYDRADILRQVKRQKRQSLLEDLKAPGADKSEMLGELRAFDEQAFGENEFVAFVNTLDGQTVVLDKASDELSEEERQRLRRELLIAPGEALALAAELCNLVVGTASDNADPKAPDTSTYGEGTANPTPPEPETYSTPAPTAT